MKSRRNGPFFTYLQPLPGSWGLIKDRTTKWTKNIPGRGDCNAKPLGQKWGQYIQKWQEGHCGWSGTCDRERLERTSAGNQAMVRWGRRELMMASEAMATEAIINQETGLALPWPLGRLVAAPLGPLELSPKVTHRKSPVTCHRAGTHQVFNQLGSGLSQCPHWHGASTFLHYFYCYLFLFFGFVAWHVGSWFCTRNQIRAPCVGSTES